MMEIEFWTVFVLAHAVGSNEALITETAVDKVNVSFPV